MGVVTGVYITGASGSRSSIITGNCDCAKECALKGLRKQLRATYMSCHVTSTCVSCDLHV